MVTQHIILRYLTHTLEKKDIDSCISQVYTPQVNARLNSANRLHCLTNIESSLSLCQQMLFPNCLREEIEGYDIYLHNLLL